MKLKIMLALLIAVLVFISKAENVIDDDEMDAVIEFDESDDLFMFLSQRESTVIHLYSRKDKQYLPKRKAFR